MNNNPYLSVASVILGAGVIGIVLWKLPIVEILYLFAMIVVIPLALFASLGLVSKGSMEIIVGGAKGFRNRVNEAMNKLKDELEDNDLDRYLKVK